MSVATPLLDSVSQALALKIQDPTPNGKDDGKIFSSDLRLGYINRAVGNMLRTLEATDQVMTDVFPDYYQVLTGADIVVTGDVIKLVKKAKPLKVFFKQAADSAKTEEAVYIIPMNYLDGLNEISNQYKASTANRKWSIVNGEIKLLPKDLTYHGVQVFARNPFEKLLQGTEATKDLEMSPDYVEILILTASREAFADKGMQVQYGLTDRILQEAWRTALARANKPQKESDSEK